MLLVPSVRKLALAAVALVWSATALSAAGIVSRLPRVTSPSAESVTALLDGWRRAEAYANAHPGCEVFVGRGDSMLPLYRDGTVLVVRSIPMSALSPGMTVVFTGDRGALVAHTLMEKTLSGWRVMGVGNREPDRTRVNRRNLVGVVIKAYATALPGRQLAAQ
jgi:hypothetical protein